MSIGYEQIWDLDDPGLVSALDETPIWSAPFGQVLLDAVLLKPNLTVLDIGSGLGFPMLELAQRLGPSAAVLGLDPWRAGLCRIRSKVEIIGATGCGVVQGSAEAMPFSDGAFDLITSNNGLNNVGNRALALRECHRVARAGASLIATENTPESMKTFYDTYAETLTALGKEERVAAMREQIREKRLPPEETAALMRDAGFEIQGMTRHGFVYRFLNGTAMLRHFTIRLAFLPGFLSILEPSERARVLGSVEARLNEKAEREGGLSLSIPFVCIRGVKP